MTQIIYCIVLLALTSSIQPLSLDTKEVVFGNFDNVPRLFRDMLSTIAISSAMEWLPPPPINFELKCMRQFDMRSMKNNFSAGLELCLDPNSAMYKDFIEEIELEKDKLSADLQGMMTTTSLTAGNRFLIRIFPICQEAYNQIDELECVKKMKPELMESLQKIMDNVNKCMEN